MGEAQSVVLSEYGDTRRLAVKALIDRLGKAHEGGTIKDGDKGIVWQFDSGERIPLYVVREDKRSGREQWRAFALTPETCKTCHRPF